MIVPPASWRPSSSELLSRRLHSLFDTRSIRFASAGLSGAFFYFSLGLKPLWPIAWIASVPLLLATFHASRSEARLLAAIASIIGLSSLVPYYFSVQGWSGLLIVLLQMLGWVLLVSFTRSVVLRSDRWFTVFAYPLACAALDTLISAFSPHGTFGSFAYTQMDALAVTQIASGAGAAGVVFLVSLFTSAVALALYRRQRRREPRLAFTVPLVIVCAAVAFGWLRLTKFRTSAETVPIGMVAIDDIIGGNISREESEAVWHGYENAIGRLAEAGARIVVLPEKIDVNEPAPDARRGSLAEIARRNAIHLVAGLGLKDESGWRNRAWLFGPAGDLLAEYDKQHLVPGWESAMTPGNQTVVREIDGHRFGISICKDMHFAALGRSYGKEAVAAVLEPAWDFRRDAWMAARIAALRGIENGYAVVHSARHGVLSASDRYGRFVAEVPSTTLPGTATIAQVPISAAFPTLYARFGDWFGWLCVLGALLIRFSTARSKRGERHAQPRRPGARRERTS